MHSDFDENIFVCYLIFDLEYMRLLFAPPQYYYYLLCKSSMIDARRKCRNAFGKYIFSAR